MKTAEEILKERGSVYGPFDEVSEVSQDIEHLIIGGNKRAKFTAAQREAIKMVSSKLARLACGDPNHLDSWLDASNYLKLAYDDTLKKVNPKRDGQGAKLSEADRWRCTKCGRIGTVGRCCGEDTREQVTPNVEFRGRGTQADAKTNAACGASAGMKGYASGGENE